MRPLIVDFEHSIFDLSSGGRIRPGGRDLLQALAAAQVPLALLATAAPEQRTEKEASLAAILHREGLGETEASVTNRTVVVDTTTDDEAAVAARRYEEGLRAAASCCGVGDHAHKAVLLSYDPAHLEIARMVGLLAYPLGEESAAAEVLHARGSDIAADLLQTLRWHPCDKRRETAKGRITPVPAARKAADPAIAALIAGVSEARLKATMEALVAWGTRWTFAPHIDQVTAAIGDLFVAAGYPQAEIRFQPFSLPGSTSQRNVLCGAATAADGVVLLCAHYDSVSRAPAASAPGGDDNASGIAVMIEAARLLQEAGLDQHILCAAFGGEEQGLYGSQACATIAATEGWNIRLVINLDMVGYRDPARPDLVTVEFDQGNAQPGNDAVAKAYATTMSQAATDYTQLKIEHTDIWNSDYMPFEAKGFACIGLYDGAADTPFYHSADDNLEKVDLARLVEITQLVVATVALITRQTPTGELMAPADAKHS